MKIFMRLDLTSEHKYESRHEKWAKLAGTRHGWLVSSCEVESEGAFAMAKAGGALDGAANE
jgi:hypothetical protein